jgi:predicted HTH transcriptional regulator
MTYRSRVLAVVNASPHWMTAREIANQASITYKQAIYALNSLYNLGSLARQGRKSTARWGSLCLVEHDPSPSAVAILEAILCRR